MMREFQIAGCLVYRSDLRALLGEIKDTSMHGRSGTSGSNSFTSHLYDVEGIRYLIPCSHTMMHAACTLP